SMLAAEGDGRIHVKPRLGCAALMRGYEEWLLRGGRPFVLMDKPKWLSDLARHQTRVGPLFWKHLLATPRCQAIPFPAARKLLEDRLPEPNLTYDVHQRRAGLGSL